MVLYFQISDFSLQTNLTSNYLSQIKAKMLKEFMSCLFLCFPLRPMHQADVTTSTIPKKTNKTAVFICLLIFSLYINRYVSYPIIYFLIGDMSFSSTIILSEPSGLVILANPSILVVLVSVAFLLPWNELLVP